MTKKDCSEPAERGRAEVKRCRNVQYVLAGVIALISLLVYLPALQNAFVGVWDDNDYVVENSHIRSLDVAFLRWSFLAFHSSNWHPLTWISHALDYAIWGLNPLGHHLMNIIFHAINTLVVVLLMVRLLDTAQERTAEAGASAFFREKGILIAAGITGLLFGLHPVHVESVAWVAERKDLLCALFFLLSIMAYTSYVTKPLVPYPRVGNPLSNEDLAQVVMTKPAQQFLKRQYLYALVFFILALMSKPMAVTLPVVLLIFDWYPFNRVQSFRTLRLASLEKIPFFALSLVSSIITILAQDAGKSLRSLEHIPFSSRLLVAMKSLIAYLGKMLLPLNLIPFYPYPKNVSLFSFEYLSAIILTIGITVFCTGLVKKQKFWLSAWGYYIVTLLPVLGIIQVGDQSMADRYTYLPSLGPFLAAGLCTAGIPERVSIFRKRPIPAKVVCSAGVLIVFSCLTYGTVRQISAWGNALILWNYVITKGVESPTAYNNRGIALDDMGQWEAARADFERAITLDARNFSAYNNLGVLYGEARQYQRSIEYFLKAIAINPQHADSYCNLGLSYFYLNQYDRALENYSKAIELKPDFDMAYLNRGNSYFNSNKKELALKDYRKACDLGNRKGCEVFHTITEGLLSQ